MQVSEETKQLLRAVFDNNGAMVEKLLKDGRANPAALDSYAIQESATNGHDKVLKLLLEDGRANPAALNNYAIKDSAENGHDKVVKLLLEDGRANPAALDNYAIRLSARNGHFEVVNLLLEDKDKRANPAALNNYAIRSSARNGHDKVVKLLLEDGRADPTADENYAINMSARYGHFEVVKLLLEDGRADPTADTNYAIRLSARNGHFEVVNLLLEDGRANPAALDNYAIRYSAKNGHFEVVNLLLKDGRANPAALDNYAIKLSAESGHDKVVKLLLEDGRANPAADSNYAISASVQNMHLDVVKLLLKDERVDPTVVDNYAFTYTGNGHLKVVNVLTASFFINKVLVERNFKIYMTYNNTTSTWKSFRAVTSQDIQLTTVLQYFETLQRTFKNVFQTEEDQQTLPYLLHFSHKQLLSTKKYQKARKDRERQIRNIAFTYFFMVQYSLIQLKKGEITSIYDNAEKWSFHYAKDILLDQWLPNMGASYNEMPFLIKEFNKLKKKKGLEYEEALKRLARIMSIKYEEYLFEKIKAKLFPTETQNNLQPRQKKVKLEKTEDKTRRPQTVQEMLPDWIDLKLKQRLKF